MKQKNFEIFIPISKSIKSDGEHGRFVRGWASVPKEDRDGDVILPSELNINTFMRIGYVNYEHKKGGKYKLATPTDKSYIDPKRGFFLEAKLFDDNPYADKMWDLAQRVNAGEVSVDDDNMLGFSIEATYSHRDYDDPRIIRNVNVTNVALTTHPSNTSSSWSTFVKSFTTGDGIVEDGDDGGQALRRQSFARDVRELSYKIKDFTVEDWSEICKSLDNENRYDSVVSKTLNYLTKSTLDDEPTKSNSFLDSFTEMLGERIEDSEDINLNKIEKSNEEPEQVSTEPDVTETETQVSSETENQNQSDSANNSETAQDSESTNETGTNSEVDSQSESANSDDNSESTNVNESESDTSSDTDSQSAVESETDTNVSVSEQDNSAQSETSEPETSDVVDSTSTENSDSQSESDVVTEQPTSTKNSSEVTNPDATETETTNSSMTAPDISEEVKSLTANVEKLQGIIEGLQKELNDKKLDIPDVKPIENNETNETDDDLETDSGRKLPIEADGEQDLPEDRPSIAQEESIDTDEESDDNAVPEDDTKVDSFIQKLEDNLSEIRYRLLPSEFIQFNNALRHLRSGSASTKDGQILQDTLKTVDLRSKVQ